MAHLSMGAKNNSGQKFVSLSGEEVNKDYFAHNNMVPFFGGNLKSKNIDATSNEATLDNYVGSGSTYMNKKEQAPLFNPGLANNGFSSAARTRHINIRYFFVKDRIAKGEI